MAYSLFGERPAMAAASHTPFAGFTRWLAARKAEQRRRAALTRLMELDDSLLDDLGVNRGDVLDAVRNPTTAGLRLARSRARTVDAWYRIG